MAAVCDRRQPYGTPVTAVIDRPLQKILPLETAASYNNINYSGGRKYRRA
jgi:hypothetical protein